ncbi:putative DNA-binding domain-containing protein [Nitratireductor basaltis]|uniref:Putative DNA-binding domain-containing protein n=1 Tax=Nitratireductor basaltis TaxID=472175 RepID=A0A084U832_9HYPH|nr:putative DNA-binding domain-containing protein [Nitratireductor basaltis]KFB09118.1 hypothetical protein EL18_00133 [Nitratireductor basaltis]
MVTSSETQSYDRDLAKALSTRGASKPERIVGPRGKAAEKRFDVYRNNVSYSIASALLEIYPATARVIAEDNFRRLAAMYVERHPPRSPLLFEYGREMSTFLEGFEPLSHLPYLADLARLERAWLDAYHAADAAPLDGETLASCKPEDLPGLRLTPHPAMRIVASPYAILDIFNANRGSDMTRRRINAANAQTVLVTRPQLTVELAAISSGQAVFLESLSAGKNFAEAIQSAQASEPGFDLASAIALMIERGAMLSPAQ